MILSLKAMNKIKKVSDLCCIIVTPSSMTGKVTGSVRWVSVVSATTAMYFGTWTCGFIRLYWLSNPIWLKLWLNTDINVFNLPKIMPLLTATKEPCTLGRAQFWVLKKLQCGLWLDLCSIILVDVLLLQPGIIIVSVRIECGWNKKGIQLSRLLQIFGSAECNWVAMVYTTLIT